MSGKLKYLIIFLATFFVITGVLHAQETQSLKDSDKDGITDQAEINQYKTDPNKWDTDGDGYFDGIEVIYNTDPLNKNETPVTNYEPKNIKFLNRTDPLLWYIARISGISAFILFTFVVCFGLIQSSRSLIKIKIMSVPMALDVHKTIAWTAFALLLLHIGSLFFDQYFQLKIPELINPLSINRDFTSGLGYDFKLPVSIGVIGLYLAIVLLATSTLRAKLVSMKTWRVFHYLTFLGYISFIVHGYLTGSDSTETWMKVLYVGSLVLVITLIIARIFRKKLFFRKPAAPLPSENKADIIE